MGRHVFLSVLAFTLVAVVAGIFLFPGKEQRRTQLPWQISQSATGNLQVFELELGRTTLGETEQTLREPAVVSLFAHEDGSKVVEAYFDSVDMSGLRARVVVVVALSEEELKAMYANGVRVAGMGGGRQKVTVSEADLARLKQTPIASLTYLPRANLDAGLITARFGEPAERIKEKEGVIEHWLYPEKGLDIALDAEGKEVFQYVQPRDFEKLRAPLLAQAEK